MKIFQTAKYSVLIFVAFILTGCPGDQESQNQSGEVSSVSTEVSQKPESLEVLESFSFIEELTGLTAQQRDQAVASIKKELESIDDKIATIKEAINQKQNEYSEDAIKRHQETLDQIIEKRHMLTEWTDKIQQDSNLSWEEAIEGFTSVYSTLAESVKEAKEMLENDKQHTS